MFVSSATQVLPVIDGEKGGWRWSKMGEETDGERNNKKRVGEQV
jgi:hypothetical protein